VKPGHIFNIAIVDKFPVVNPQIRQKLSPDEIGGSIPSRTRTLSPPCQVGPPVVIAPINFRRAAAGQDK
jgi:hypothetical protein